MGGKGGLNGLRPSRAAAWISNLDVCEGSILFEFVNEISSYIRREFVNRNAGANDVYFSIATGLHNNFSL